jgi:transposase
LPNLSKPTVIVMDNASFHKNEALLELIKAKGHIVEFLPPYSPDLNPIEHKWAEKKA